MNWNGLELPDKDVYFKDDDVLIYCADCREVLPLIPDKSIDLVLTSPPYDNLRDYGGYSFDFNTVSRMLYERTFDGGVVVWVVGDATINGSETGTSFRQALRFMELGFNLHDTMIYQKNWVTYPDDDRYYSSFEYMFVFSKGKPKSINLLSDRKNLTLGKVGGSERRKDGTLNYDRACKGKERKPNGIRYNIWQYSEGDKQNVNGHPAQYPNQLACDHINSWSNPDELILDPFLGSGTTAYCAKKLNRKCIGIEIEEKYCEIAAKRCSQSVMKLDI